MNIIIRCAGCGKELELKDKLIDVLGNIVLDVKTCDNMNCYDCSGCEEFHNMKDKS